MLALSLLTALAPQLTPGPDLRASPVRQLPTLEGVQGGGRVGLFEVRSGAFVPGWLDHAVAELTDITTLDVDFAGRAEVTSSLPGSPRLRADTGAGSRVELPNGQGTLYRLRARRAGQLVFVILHVDGAGRPRIALEQPATAANGDPFLEKISISRGGESVLAATVPAAGGDLFELDLTSGRTELRTAQLAPIDFGKDGLWLGDGWGFGVGSQGVYRFVRRPGAQAAVVPVLGPPPVRWRGDAAISPRGSAGVAIAGSGPDQWTPYVLTISGSCRAAADVGAAISSAGYLPESLFGPFLAVLDDGQTAAWRIELTGAPGSGGIRDVVIGRADLPAGAVVASGDPVILDTLNEIGRVIPSPVGEILFAVGEPNVPEEGGLESSDIFAATVSSAGALTIRNVSGSSGDIVAPFTTAVPTWTPARLAMISDDVALVHDDDRKQLIALDVVAGTATLVLADVREVAWLETSGPSGAWSAAVRRDDAQRNWQVVSGDTPRAAAVVLDPGSPLVQFAHPTALRMVEGSPGSLQAAVAYIRVEGGVEHLDVVEPAALQRTRWSAVAGRFTPPLAFVGPRVLAFSRSAGAAGSLQRLWAFRGPALDRAVAAPIRPSRLLR